MLERELSLLELLLLFLELKLSWHERELWSLELEIGRLQSDHEYRFSLPCFPSSEYLLVR